MKGKRQTQRREANALTSHRAPRNVRASRRRGQRARLTRGQAQQQEHRARERGQLEAAWDEPAKAPRRLAQSGGRARAACAAPAPLAPPRPSPRPQHPNEIPRNGKIRASCMIRGVCAAKRSPSWQDLRAVYSRKAICMAFRIHGARILPKSAHFGCMAAICCQEGALFPSEAPFGIHEAQNLPRIAARERTRAKYCHRQAPENAPWRHGTGRRHANETSANSTPRADTSKKP